MKRNLITNIMTLALASTSLNAAAAIGTISGPFNHANLQIFLVHGNTQLENRHYATLSEALAKGIVIVRETGNVNELSIENVSGSTIIFLNAGDIVKGGRQDRTVRDDLILPPKSGPVPLASFCVEHGRWTKRGEENATAFSSNSKVLSSRQLKMAARYGANQNDVWSGVAEQQNKLNENVSRLAGKPVDTRNSDSSSSLQLSLENKDLEAVQKQYFSDLSRILDGKTDIIGFLYAINGEINTAEVYNNKSLFRALWPKLLDSAVTEAITECPKDGHPPRVENGQVKSFFETAVSGSPTERRVWKTTLVRTFTTSSTVLFETLDLEADGAWIHKSFFNKSKETLTVPLDREGANNR
jgi:hypothetical protein